MKNFKNVLSVLGLSLLATLSFATVSAATTTATVTAVGTATSSVVNVTKPVVYVATNTCPNFISSYNKLGSYGPEVVKLQNFLNRVNGANLNGQGYFGPVTQQEVKNFQYTYGIKPTGYQHVLTTKMINDINCGKVAPKARKVYVLSSMAQVAKNMNYVAPAPVISTGVSVDSIKNNAKNLVKEYEVPKPIKLTGTTTPKLDMGTKTSFWENLGKDWNKIKENYKAYLLVFALVLALFWFLRKAATE